MRKNKDFDEIYGFHAVNAALRNKSRKFRNLIISSKNRNRIDKNLLIKIETLNEIPIKEINRIYYKEGYVYAPGRKKRDLMQEIASILWTFEI